MYDLPSSAELDALRLSLDVAVRSVAFTLPVAVLAAWVLTRVRFPGRMLLDAFVHLPMVLPPVAVGYTLLLLLGVHAPLGAWLARQFGIVLPFTTAGAALATAVMTFPLMVRAVRLSLENVDRGLEDAARTLGAAPVDRFVSVTLPLMLPGPRGAVVRTRAAGTALVRGAGAPRASLPRRVTLPTDYRYIRPVTTQTVGRPTVLRESPGSWECFMSR